MSGTSVTTSDAEIARNPHQPEGWRRDSIDFLVAPPPRYALASRRRRFANSTPSRSPQRSPYLWSETLRCLPRSRVFANLMWSGLQLSSQEPVEFLDLFRRLRFGQVTDHNEQENVDEKCNCQTG